MNKNLLHLILLGSALPISGAIVYGIINAQKAFDTYKRSQEIERLMRTENTLASYEQNVQSKTAPTLKKALLMDESMLNTNQKMRRSALVGDIYMSYFSKPPKDSAIEKEAYRDIAVKAYLNALEYAHTKDERNTILRKIGEIYVQAKNWKKALDLYKEAESTMFPMTPEERWKLKLNEAKCYRNIGNCKEALQLYSQVADESDNNEIWGKAAIEKGDLYLAAAKNQDVLRSILNDPAAKLETYREKNLEDAFKIYSAIAKELPLFNQDNAKAQLGLLEICVLRKNKKAAYELTNSIQATATSSTEKASALMLLAQLEEDLGNYEKAIEILEMAQTKYPKSSLRLQISYKLYELYKKNENWSLAFNTAEQLFLQMPDEETIIKIMRDFEPGEKNILTSISCSPDKDRYIARTRKMLDNIEDTQPEIWKKISTDANFTFAEILYFSGKYEAAERELDHCILTFRNRDDLLEQVSYMDLMCAIKAKRSPVIALARAKRYLSHFPKGKHAQEVLLDVLDNYYNMALYDSAISVAKKIYIDEMNDAKNNNNKNLDHDMWMKTIARIGESYYKLGFYDRANKIIKSYADKLLSSPLAPEVYMDWAKVAENQEQTAEAIRRLDVVLPYTTNMFYRYKIYLAQYLLKLKTGDDADDFKNARKLLEKIDSSEKLSPEEKFNMEELLYEGLLEYAFKNNKTDDFNQLLSSAAQKFNSEAWPLYWMLRSISSYFGNAGLDVISRKYEDFLGGAKDLRDKDKDTFLFVERQLNLIKDLEKLEDDARKFKEERGIPDERNNQNNPNPDQQL